MDGQNYLVFHNDSNDSYANTSANFRGADVGTEFIDLYFHAAQSSNNNNGSSGYDKVRLEVLAGKEEVALEGVMAGFAGNKHGAVTVIADDVNSKYIHENVEAVTSITLASQGQYRTVEAITNAAAVTRTLTTAESGTLFTVNMSTIDNNVALTLPIATDAGVAGVYYDFCFLVDCDDDADFSLSTGADAIDMFGSILRGQNNTANEFFVIPGKSKLTIDADVGQAIEGMTFGVVCDGANWHISGYNPTAVGTANMVSADAA
tara:strand:+ start:126 stop:911 length:786 start_codon:yes stop_codon:yes gene_type:complete